MIKPQWLEPISRINTHGLKDVRAAIEDLAIRAAACDYGTPWTFLLLFYCMLIVVSCQCVFPNLFIFALGGMCFVVVAFPVCFHSYFVLI